MARPLSLLAVALALVLAVAMAADACSVENCVTCNGVVATVCDKCAVNFERREEGTQCVRVASSSLSASASASSSVLASSSTSSASSASAPATCSVANCLQCNATNTSVCLTCKSGFNATADNTACTATSANTTTTTTKAPNSTSAPLNTCLVNGCGTCVWNDNTRCNICKVGYSVQNNGKKCARQGNGASPVGASLMGVAAAAAAVVLVAC